VASDLITARLLLRRPAADDVPSILAIHRDERACAHNPSDRLVAEGEALDLYHRWDEHWRRHGFGYWVVYHQDDREILGFCGVKLMQLHGLEVLNLFYRLDPAVWGRGFATEAAIAVAQWAAADASHWPVVARVRPANTASIRVAERAGLRRAERLDTFGEDGHDLIYAARWPVS
jgi:RimJ/RimL family protein N-acetyltransferase